MPLIQLDSISMVLYSLAKTRQAKGDYRAIAKSGLSPCPIPHDAREGERTPGSPHSLTPSPTTREKGNRAGGEGR